VWAKAVDDARSLLGLASAAEIRLFISQGGLQEPEYAGTSELETYTGPPPVPLVDGYSFSAGELRGYIAFYRGTAARLVIKSFKKNLVQGAGQDPLTYSPFRALLEKEETM
jgi:hypothetical protein